MFFREFGYFHTIWKTSRKSVKFVMFPTSMNGSWESKNFQNIWKPFWYTLKGFPHCINKLRKIGNFLDCLRSYRIGSGKFQDSLESLLIFWMSSVQPVNSSDTLLTLDHLAKIIFSKHMLFIRTHYPESFKFFCLWCIQNIVLIWKNLSNHIFSEIGEGLCGQLNFDTTG